MVPDAATPGVSPPARALAVIPARYASSRFPGKPLARRTGKYLVQHVVERVQQAASVGGIIVATDDRRIFDAVCSFGGQAMMTGADHPNGTSRIAEVVARLGRGEGPSCGFMRAAPIVVNVQGDEPDIEPQVIDLLVDAMVRDPSVPMGTVASPFAADEDPRSTNIVKVVCDRRGRALYFSRSLIPFDREGRGVQPLKHMGLYAYRREFLPAYVALPPTPLEQAEQLEQLRALEHGCAITVVPTAARYHGIDTPQQYDDFVRRVLGS